MTKEEAKKILIARIEHFCKKENISYYALSYKATIPLTTLSHIMDGTTQNPGIFTIMKICDGLGVTMKEFFDTKEFEGVMGECE